MEPYFDIGTYTRGTSTASTSAQMWFDRGLVWSYAFHHEEAIRCFERAVEHDPGFAPAHWGIAYAIGPNYNKQWEAFDPVDLAAPGIYDLTLLNEVLASRGDDEVAGL